MSTKKSPLLSKQNSKEANTEPSRQASKYQGPAALLTTPASKDALPSHQDGRKTAPATRIIVNYNVGFGNALYLRGKGASLSWDRGILLKNTEQDKWVWETSSPFTTCEFKVLINDTDYENGENRLLACGAHLEYAPTFS